MDESITKAKSTVFMVISNLSSYKGVSAPIPATKIEHVLLLVSAYCLDVYGRSINLLKSISWIKRPLSYDRQLRVMENPGRMISLRPRQIAGRRADQLPTNIVS